MMTARKAWQGTVLGSVVLVFGSLFGWLIDTAPPIEIRSVDVRSVVVPRGGFLTVEYVVARHRSCPGVLQRIIVDSQDVVQFVNPQQLTVADDGGDPDLTRVSVSVPVPFGAAPGLARYQAVVKYQCNPLQRFLGSSIEVRAPAVEFEVLPIEATIPQRSLPGRDSDRSPALPYPYRHIGLP